MVKSADLLVCDSKNIEKYIRETYAKFNPNTTYIAYGAEIRHSKLADDAPSFVNWLNEKGLTPKDYYLVVGRFVPENNYETMIREFMNSKTTKSFALITNVNDRFLKQLKQRTGFDRDPRIKFVGTVYDEELLMKIREQAYGYFHGHEVGGTNPSLLEALASSELNLLLDVGFNREVAEDSAIYWTKTPGSLAETIERVDGLSPDEIKAFAKASTERIANAYSWEFIASEYDKVWKKENPVM
jgi:rhamnosyltransferase